MIHNRLIALLLTVTVGEIAVAQDSPPPAEAVNLPSREIVLGNLPTNSDQRCIGIAMVSEALLDGVRLEEDGPDDVTEIVQQIYRSLTDGQIVRYRRDVMIGATRVPILSGAAIDKLSTLVADKYKRDYFRLLKTEAGRQKLFAAQSDFVVSSRDLERILAADADELDAFCGVGRRVFPDGEEKETTHAFLIGRGPDDKIVVYDPNDPGLPIACQISNTEDGVTIEWTCRYRDTGHVTTQTYRIVHKDKFFGLLVGE
ncbi:MAG: hypothetical protein WD070_02410 [Pirellulaceae bacterium]